MKEEKDILDRLLNKYERSKHLKNPGSSKNRVMLNNLKKDLPEYNYEKLASRDAYNQGAKKLEQEELVSLEWSDDKTVLVCITLNLHHVFASYKHIGRVHPKERALAVINLIQEELDGVSTFWIKAWARDMLQKAEEDFKVPYYCKENLDFLKDLLTAFRHYDSLTESVTMRAFSIRCYKDTKYFERHVRTTFLSIAKKYYKTFSSICEEAELGLKDQLAVLGIYARPELYELAGNCRIETKTGWVDIGATAGFGLAIPSTLVDDITAIDLSKIGVITFIENKTNYDEYLLKERAKQELVVYHGGFLSPKRQKFFALLGSALPEGGIIRFWADIDLGGFQMFRQMQESIPNILPMRMEGTFVEQYHKTGLARSEEYLSKLKKVMEEETYPLFSEAIKIILYYGVTIEQEVFLNG